MHITGHHTCSKEGNWQEIEAHGPFYSEYDETDPEKHKFLGSGYYFWDNNLGMAHYWGRARYKNEYYIFESEIELNNENFLDLVGNRRHMLWLKETLDELSPLLEEADKTVGGLIEVLKELSNTEEYSGIFPYKAIRAVDNSYSIKPENQMKFTLANRSFMNLNPVYAVCLVDLDREIFRSFTKIRESKG